MLYAEYILQLLTNPVHYELKPWAPGHPLLFLSFRLSNKNSIIPSTPGFVLGFFWFCFLVCCIFLYIDKMLLLLQLKLIWTIWFQVPNLPFVWKMAYTCPLTRAKIHYHCWIVFLKYAYYKAFTKNGIDFWISIFRRFSPQTTTCRLRDNPGTEVRETIHHLFLGISK